MGYVVPHEKQTEKKKHKFSIKAYFRTITNSLYCDTAFMTIKHIFYQNSHYYNALLLVFFKTHYSQK